MNRGGGGEEEEGATRFEQLYKAISGLPINIVKADLHRSKVDIYIYILGYDLYFCRVFCVLGVLGSFI